MGAATNEVPATARFMASDERGVGLRVTWRPALGLVNLSLWSDQRCAETFHLTPDQSAELIAFLASSLASVAPEPQLVSALRSVPPVTDRRTTAASEIARSVRALRERAALRMEEVARRLRP